MNFRSWQVLSRGVRFFLRIGPPYFTPSVVSG
jgi:hypothetical protein